MTRMKTFAIADILSATGPMVSPRLIDAVYDVLDHIIGDDLFTHVLPRASEAMTLELHRQFPWLVEALAMLSDFSAIPQNQLQWQVATDVERIAGAFGATHPVESAEHLWERRDPIAELVDLVGADRVVPIVLPGAMERSGDDMATTGRWDQGSAGEPVVWPGEGGIAAPTQAQPADPDPQDGAP